MPKKFDTNTKSAEARARKESVKQANELEKQKRLEDEYWKDDDKNTLKKQQRKDERDKKEQEKVQRKIESQQLLEQEAAALTASKSKKNSDLAPKKVTQTQIQQHQVTAMTAAAEKSAPKQKNLNTEEMTLEENVNRMKIEGASARNVDEALQVLSSTDKSDVDTHPEKRMKAAYQTFEDETLPRLKQENPTLRLSQLKQLLKKEWLKSPDNPFNKPTKAYNQSNKIDEIDHDSDDD